MTDPKCKLVVVPEGWKVVPEEPSDEIIQGFWGDITCGEDEKIVAVAAWKDAIKNAPPIDTPPVLRWEKCEEICWQLFVGKIELASVVNTGTRVEGYISGHFNTYFESEQEARRAAEKALGFPDGLIIPVLD